MKNNKLKLGIIILILGILSAAIIRIAQYIFYNEKFDSNWEIVFWTIILTFATVFLGIIASLQDIIRSWFSKPILDCEFEVKSPDSHFHWSYHTYYFRFRIVNKGNISAKNVEVIIKDIKDKNNRLIELSQDNLVWSTHEVDIDGKVKQRMYWRFISPGTYQYCNLGYIKDPKYNQIKPKGFKESDIVFCLSVYWPTPDNRFALLPGIYSFEIIVGCENADPIIKKYKIEITGAWSDNESEMLNRGFKKIN